MMKVMASYHPFWLRLGLQALLSVSSPNLADLTGEFFLRTAAEDTIGKDQQVRNGNSSIRPSRFRDWRYANLSSAYLTLSIYPALQGQ